MWNLNVSNDVFQARDFRKLKDVIQRLAENDEFGSSFAIAGSGTFWDNLNEIVTVLEVPFIATQNMQRDGYGLADFYISWMRMHRSLSRHIDGRLKLAENLIAELHQREEKLLDTPTMLAAMYLDPRIKYKLNETQKECAMIALEMLHMRVSNSSTDNAANQSANDTLDELNAAAAANNNNNNNSTAETNVYLKSIRDSFVQYDCVLPVNIKSGVMDFWRKDKHKFPILYELACIVHAVQAGQCSVERNFSGFTHIYECRRTKLLPKNIANILMLKLNKDVHEIWQQKEIDKIRKSTS